MKEQWSKPGRCLREKLLGLQELQVQKPRGANVFWKLWWGSCSWSWVRLEESSKWYGFLGFWKVQMARKLSHPLLKEQASLPHARSISFSRLFLLQLSPRQTTHLHGPVGKCTLLSQKSSVGGITGAKSDLMIWWVNLTPDRWAWRGGAWKGSRKRGGSQVERFLIVGLKLGEGLVASYWTSSLRWVGCLVQRNANM